MIVKRASAVVLGAGGNDAMRKETHRESWMANCGIVRAMCANAHTRAGKSSTL